MKRVYVKICGITCVTDAFAAVAAGADALGFVFAPSPRQVTPEAAAAIIRELPPFVTTVGVVVDQDAAAILRTCPLDVIQFHGSESPADMARVKVRGIRALRIRSEADLQAISDYRDVASAFLLDTHVPETPGGTGQAFPWEIGRRALGYGKFLIIAGGLTPENVGEAIRQAWPHGVDVSSGVEAAPGQKSNAKMIRFVRAVERASAGRMGAFAGKTRVRVPRTRGERPGEG
jgi:phosphoribosylanthranilate isomerase